MQNALVLIKNQMNLKDRGIIDFYCFFLIIFFHNIQWWKILSLKGEDNPKSEEEKIIKDIRNLFKLTKEIKGIKDIVLRSIKTLFEYEKEEDVTI